MNKYNEVFLMLTNISFARGDSVGLMTHMLTYRRFVEIIDILIGGQSTRWWLSTRLLLGLTHDEAVRMGGDLLDFFTAEFKMGNASIMRLDYLGLEVNS